MALLLVYVYARYNLGPNTGIIVSDTSQTGVPNNMSPQNRDVFGTMCCTSTVRGRPIWHAKRYIHSLPCYYALKLRPIVSYFTAYGTRGLGQSSKFLLW